MKKAILCILALVFLALVVHAVSASERQWEGFGPDTYNFTPHTWNNADPERTLLLCWVMMESDVQWDCSKQHSCTHYGNGYSTTYTTATVGSEVRVLNSKGNKVFWGKPNAGWFGYTQAYTPYYAGYQGFCGVQNGVLIAGWSYCPSGYDCFPGS